MIRRDNPFERLAFSDMNPITDGPVRNPISPPVVTIAYPSTVLTHGIFADVLNKTGTIQQEPRPIIIYPAIAIITAGAVTTIKKPVADRKSTRLNFSHLGISYA